MFYYLKALLAPDLYSDKLIKLLLNQPFNINSKDFELINNAKTNHKSIIEAIKEIDNFIEQDKINNFIQTFEYLKEYKNNENLKNIILEVGAKTGIFNYYLNSEINKSENIAGIKKIIDEVIAANPAQVEQYKSGKVGLLGFFVGNVMKRTGGTANPATVNEILQKKLA